MKIITLFAILVVVSSAEKSKFDNYRVYRVNIDNHEQLIALRQLADSSDSYSFWDYPKDIQNHVEVMVPPHKFAHFNDISKNLNLRADVLINNLQEAFDKEHPRKQPKIDTMSWTDYHSMDTIHSWLDSLQSEFPNWVNVTNIGFSYQGRPLKLLKLSKKSGNRAIFVESNIHAREWIASATSTYLINELLRSTSPDVRDLSENVDWYFLPLSNPDGYEYTRNENRNWRKTRSVQSVLCTGVDPNRNFAYNWMIPDENGSTGSSTSPCSDVFSGPFTLSEPECAAIDTFLGSHPGIFDTYIALHSYQHSFLYPYGNTRNSAPNSAELQAVGEFAAEKLNQTHGIQYSVGTWHSVLYPSSGSSMDNAYGRHHIPISYTIEMRGNGEYGNFGFFLPPEFIIPNAEEILNAFVGLVQKAREFGRF